MLLHLFLVLFDNECVNTREKVVKKGVFYFKANKIVITRSIFEVCNGVK